MGWLIACGGKLVVGKTPSTTAEYRYIQERVGCKTEVCLGKQRRSPLSFQFRVNTELSADLLDGSLKEQQCAERYVKLARSIAARLTTKRKPVYVHYKDGNLEEVFVGMVLWRLMDAERCPRNIVQWLCEHHPQALQAAADKKMMQLIWDELYKQTEVGLHRYFKR